MQDEVDYDGWNKGFCLEDGNYVRYFTSSNHDHADDTEEISDRYIFRSDHYSMYRPQTTGIQVPTATLARERQGYGGV